MFLEKNPSYLVNYLYGLLFMIPFVLFPSFAPLLYLAMKKNEQKESLEEKIFPTFFKIYIKEYKDFTKIGLIFTVLGLIFSVGIGYYWNRSIVWALFLVGIFLFEISTLEYVLPLLATRNSPLGKTIKNAILLTAFMPFNTLTAVVSILCIVFIAYYTIPGLIFLLVPELCAYACYYFYCNGIKKFENES